MAQLDPIIFCEIPVIERVIQDETWYEGQRRGCYVSPDDPVVQENVCAIILRIGWELREKFRAQLAADPGPAMLPPRGSGFDQAA